MRHLLLSIFIITLNSMILNAQSLIVTSDGQPITGYDVTITDDGIFYRISESADSQFVKLERGDISIVRHKDGTVVDIAQQSSLSTSTQKQDIADVEQQTKANINDYLDHKYNKAIIEKHNTPAEIIFENEKGKKKKVNFYRHEYYATLDSQFASIDLIIDWRDATLINRSDKVIFVDLANTFFSLNGWSEPYYTPGAVSSTSGGSTGASVNIGGIARAVGIGGAAGAIARGVNVGGSKSNYSTSVTYSQRIISIPPRSTYELNLGRPLHHNYDLQLPTEVGDFTEYNEQTTPKKLSRYVTYSFTEDFTTSYTLSSTLYLIRVIGCNRSSTAFTAYPQVIPVVRSVTSDDNSSYTHGMY